MSTVYRFFCLSDSNLQDIFVEAEDFDSGLKRAREFNRKYNGGQPVETVIDRRKMSGVEAVQMILDDLAEKGSIAQERFEYFDDCNMERKAGNWLAVMGTIQGYIEFLSEQLKAGTFD